mmetsp:Transcript_36875/g.75569  ORF Transcript_36875/g.75569 Transcript_36875/m.75569 type:complete len:87 (-) Transcript_36875:144-404(-)
MDSQIRTMLEQDDRLFEIRSHDRANEAMIGFYEVSVHKLAAHARPSLAAVSKPSMDLAQGREPTFPLCLFQVSDVCFWRLQYVLNV